MMETNISDLSEIESLLDQNWDLHIWSDQDEGLQIRMVSLNGGCSINCSATNVDLLLQRLADQILQLGGNHETMEEETQRQNETT